MVRKKIILVSIMSIIVIFSLSLWFANPTMNGLINIDQYAGKDSLGYSTTPQMQIIWQTQPELEALPELLIEKIPLNESIVRQIAANAPFNMSANMQFHQIQWGNNIEYGVYTGSTSSYYMIGFLQNGAMYYLTPGWNGPYAVTPMPSEAEAKQIADDFLSEVQRSGAFFPTGEQQLVFSSVMSNSVSSNPSGIEQVNSLIVRYNFEYNGIPIKGGYYGVSVEIGAGGQVLDCFAEWRNLVPSGRNIEITVTPQLALDKLQSTLSQSPTTSNSTMIIQGVRLVYSCDAGMLYDLAPLSPLYEFNVLLIDSDGQQISSVIHAKATA